MIQNILAIIFIINIKKFFNNMKRKTYWVYLNGKYIADYRTLRGCLDFIERRKLEANYDNDLGIIDNEGNEYHPYTGKMMNESLRENLSLNESNIKEIKRTLNYNDLIRTIEHITGAFDVTYTQEINDMVIHIYEPDYRGTYICVKVFDYMYGDVYFSEEVKYERSETCYRKIYNAYKKAVSLCEKDSLMESKRINEWNMWDGDRRSSYPRQTRMIDVADDIIRKPIHNKARYNNDPEYHNHIKRLEDELRRTDEPQHAEYLERRISKLKSLVEGVKLSRTSRAINEMARKKKVYQVVAKCDYRDRSTDYVCDEFPTKREALRYRKEECYDTPSRCHIIREVIKDDINEGERSSSIRNEIANKNAELLCELKFDLLDLLEEYYRLSGTYEVNVRYKTVNGVEVSKISTELDDVDYEDARILRWRPKGSKLEPITIEEYDFYISEVEDLIKQYRKGELSLVGGAVVKRLVNHYKDYRVFICRGFQYRGARYVEDDKETKKTYALGGTFEERINELCEYYAAFDIRIDRGNKTLYINAFSSNDLY